MWATKLRNQARLNSKINCIRWIDGNCCWTSNERNDGSEIKTNKEEKTTCCGWMLFGGGNGELGVSWIGSGNCSDADGNKSSTKDGSLFKSHFNLRGGHTGGVKYVRWKPQGDKIVSYDGWGNVCVWRNRSSIFALDFTQTTVNPVTDIQWSPCGHYIAICGDEGQLQVLSGYDGSSVFTIHATSTTMYGQYAEFACLSWNATSTKIALGTSKGEVILVDPQDGQFLAMIGVHKNLPVCQIDFFGSLNFSKEEVVHQDGNRQIRDNWIASQSLSLYMEDGEVLLFPSASDTHFSSVETRITRGKACWNSSQTLLAVVGYRNDTDACTVAASAPYLTARLVNTTAHIVMTMEPLLNLPPYVDSHDQYQQQFCLSSICWGLQDSTIFIACGCNMFSFNIWHEIPTLKVICREFIKCNVRGGGGEGSHHKLQTLPLPSREISLMRSSLLPPPYDAPMMVDTTTDYLLIHKHHQEQLFSPPSNGQRLYCVLTKDHCQMTRTPRNNNKQNHQETGYTLKYEYFGSYIPLLRATKRHRSLQQIGYNIEMMTADNYGNATATTKSHWGNTPAAHYRPSLSSSFGMKTSGCSGGNSSGGSRQQTRRNSWSPGTGNNNCTSTAPTLQRLRRTIHQLRPRSAHVLDTPLEEEEEKEEVKEDINEFESTSTAGGKEDEVPTPVIAEVSGSRLLNKFRVLRHRSMKEESGLVAAVIDINSHYITCEPRDVSISLPCHGGNESGPSSPLTLVSKKPEWNTRFKVYELDFGGRINRDSVKNFQVEMNEKIVLQFGRTKFDDYCIDFEEPFSPVTAMGVALSAIHSN